MTVASGFAIELAGAATANAAPPDTAFADTVFVDTSLADMPLGDTTLPDTAFAAVLSLPARTGAGPSSSGCHQQSISSQASRGTILLTTPGPLRRWRSRIIGNKENKSSTIASENCG